MNSTLKKSLSTGGFALTSLIFAFGLAWVTLYQLNFSYGRWHDIGQLGYAIEKYGPQNYYRSGFELTTKEQREQLFGEISYAVHHDGVGLDKITYKVPGHPLQTLLTEDEVLHLGDVAHLVLKVQALVVIGIVAWLLIVYFYYRHGLCPPSVLHQLLSIVVLMIVFVVIMLLVGPTKAFSKMHEWVFPPGNPWFFYYQQSLMSTMMWAPRLFGWIAGEWAVFALAYFCLLQFSATRLLRKLAIRPSLARKSGLSTDSSLNPESKPKPEIG